MFSRIFLIVFLICAGGLTLGGAALQAQGLISAKVLSSEGPVEIRRVFSNQVLPQKIVFKAEDKLNAGDTIITGKKGRLVLGLSDGSQAVISSQTTVVIEDLSQSPRTLFNVIRGKTRVHIETLGGQPNPYRVNTPTAVIAVRGTIFDVLVENEETQVYLHEGSVAVTNLRLPNQPVFLSAGQMTRVPLQRLPNPPDTFKPGRNDGSFGTRQQAAPSQNNGRIADRSSGQSQDRGGRPENGGSQFPGRDNRPNTTGGTDAGRGGPPSGNPGSTGNSRPGRRP